MGKRCPPGTICLENMTMIFLIVAIGIFVYFSNRSVFSFTELRNTIQHNSYQHSYQQPSQEIKHMPINVKTQGGQCGYQQIGILSRTTNQDVIMPLFGMNVNTGRDKWNYYTLTEHNVRLPINLSGKSCTSEYGCDSVGNGDMVYVEGYNDAFKVTIYDDMNQMRYIPYI